MKYRMYMYLLPVVLVIAFLFYSGVFDSEKSQSNDNQAGGQITNMTQLDFETKSDDRPPVTVKVTPIEFGRKAKVWKFAIVFDTHTGNLDDDPLRIITLSDDKGAVYQPTAWEGAGPGGHHREGVLIFNAINPAQPYVELKIRNVGGVSERVFRWSLE